MIVVDLSLPRRGCITLANIISNKVDDYLLRRKLSKHKISKVTSIVYKCIGYERVILKNTASSILMSVALNPETKTPSATDISAALDPVIEMMQALGYPIALMAITGGALTMVFNKRLGVKIIRDAAIAFLILQFVPALMNMLMGVGNALKESSLTVRSSSYTGSN